MSLKKRFQVREDIKKKIEQEDSSGDDNRVLPYYRLKDGEKMEVLIIPDENHNIWHKYSVHGGKLGVRGLKRLRCIHQAKGEECPVCQKAFDGLAESKEADTESEQTALKDKAKRWFADDRTLASVFVLESPIEIPETDDGNQIKLWHVPYKIEEKIKQMIAEGQIEPEDIPSTPFVIKRTKNAGGRASYEHSYFDRKMVDLDEVFEDFEDDELVQYDFDAMDADENETIIPSVESMDSIEEWLETAEDKVDSMERKSSRKSDSGDESGSRKDKARSKIKGRRGLASRKDEAEEAEEPESPKTLADDEAGREAADSIEQEEEKEPEQEAGEEKSSGRGLGRSLKSRRSLRRSRD